MTNNIQNNVKIINYIDVAEYFLALANDTGGTITNLKLQKLVYYAQAWHLANFSKPLFESKFQAWVHGPVIPALYEKYKVFGNQPIVKDIELKEVIKRFEPETLNFLQEIAQVYMPYDGYALELMTHKEAPWIEARGQVEPEAKCNNIIDEGAMKAFYGERLKDKTN